MSQENCKIKDYAFYIGDFEKEKKDIERQNLHGNYLTYNDLILTIFCCSMKN